MSGVEIGVLSITVLIGLIYAGMHIPIALMFVSYVGVWLLRGDLRLASNLIASTASETVAGYIFGVVPLFVLMGLLVSAADLGRDAFAAAGKVFGGRRGGLGIATVAANAVFAAITGISIASAAVFTKVAVPEMQRSGYASGFAVGIVAGSSVLGMLIPPSLLMIVFAVLSEQSVGDLFIAGACVLFSALRLP
jgi:C4-dicarboxylate transporter DctM subunit